MHTSSLSNNKHSDVDWTAVRAYLDTAHAGKELNEYLDTLVTHVFANPDREPALVLSVLEHALNLPLSPLVCRSIALAIATSAKEHDDHAVDALVQAYRRYHNDDTFLAGALLEAIGLLGLKHPLARAETIALVWRLTSQDAPYLLIKGIQVKARLHSSQPDPLLRSKIKALFDHEDMQVVSEAHYQDALLTLFDTLTVEDSEHLIDKSF